jgi:hypothetical protein
MQQAVRRFLASANFGRTTSHDDMLENLIHFWDAVKFVLPEAWANPRHFMITKGVGVYCLMSLAGELVLEARKSNRKVDLDFFISQLSDFIHKIDWSNKGPLEGFGGVKGADAALTLLRHTREQFRSNMAIYG